jgi:hypothetical protein
MKFIVNTFNKGIAEMLAKKLNGELVHKTEPLVLIDSDSERDLTVKVELILDSDNFRITERK